MVYFICATVFGLILLIQLALSLVGGGDTDMDFSGPDGDVDLGGADGTHVGTGHHHLMAHALQWISVRGLIGGMAFFGLFGMLGHAYGQPELLALGLAVAGGLIAQFVITFAFRSLMALRADGATHIKNALGTIGTVYIPIPPNRTGEGKIQLLIQNRTEEFAAQTCGDRLATGTQVKVVEVLGENLLLVKSLA